MKDLIDNFANISIFPFINLDVTLIFVVPFINKAFMLDELFSSKLIIVFIFLSSKIEFFLSVKSSLTFLFLLFFPFFFNNSRASKFVSL